MKTQSKIVPYVSQMGRGPQSQTLGCGVASLMMLLKYHDYHVGLDHPLSYEVLARVLRAYTQPEKKELRDRRGCGVYRRDVEKWLRGRDIPYKVWVRGRNNPEGPFDVSAALPIMAEMNGECWSRFGHWIVCIRATAQAVDYLDPQFRTRKIRSLPRSKFSKDWFGNAVGILGSGVRAKSA
jgi:hypothetical protein